MKGPAMLPERFKILPYLLIVFAVVSVVVPAAAQTYQYHDYVRTVRS